MPVYRLHPDYVGFPPRSEFDSDVVAVGGDLSSDRLLEAYARGVFPWYNTPGEFRWYCPLQRCVLPVQSVRISHSMRNVFNKNIFRFSMDSSFKQVMESCRSGERKGHTWIFDETVQSYGRLHSEGWAHSLEVWQDDDLVGGLYGICLGGIFFGESMFSLQPNASKAALIQLAAFLPTIDVHLIDCQVPNGHLLSMGAKLWSRNQFLDDLEKRLQQPHKLGSWRERFETFSRQ